MSVVLGMATLIEGCDAKGRERVANRIVANVRGGFLTALQLRPLKKLPKNNCQLERLPEVNSPPP